MSSKIIESTRELILPIIENEDFELVDIEYVKEGKDWFLRVFIDKDGGISIDECGFVSAALSEKLDEVDFIEGNYYLDVSSPGVERPLKNKTDFEKNVGKNVYVSLYAPIDNQKEYEGILKHFDEDVATIEYKDKTRKSTVEIPYDKIAKARLAVVL